jgi:hypothetical protein
VRVTGLVDRCTPERDVAETLRTTGLFVATLASSIAGRAVMPYFAGSLPMRAEAMSFGT